MSHPEIAAVLSGASRWCVVEGDCLEVMREMPSSSVPMLWTDPPYGHNNHDGDFNARLNEHRGIENKPIANDDGDSMRRVVDGMLKEASRVLHEDCCCCCCCCGGGGGPKPTFAWVANRMDEQGLSFFHSVIWDKNNPGIGWRYRRRHEMVMVAHRKGGKLAWANDDLAVPNIQVMSPPRNRVHPNEKPVELVARFIQWHTKPDDIVLDPFCGSGTTGVAAIQLGRRFIGIEREPQYCAIARRRIADAAAQGSLF